MPAGATDKSPRPRRRGRPPGPTVDRAQRREEILEAAIQAIRTLGSGASMDKLAAAAGITKPILYDHFGDKAGLARAVAERVTGEILERTSAALHQDLEARALACAGINSFLEFLEAEPALYRFLANAHGIAPDALPQRELVVTLAEVVGARIREALEEAGGDVRLAAPWGYAVIGQVMVASEWWLATGALSRAELCEALADQALFGVVGAGNLPAAQQRP